MTHKLKRTIRIAAIVLAIMALVLTCAVCGMRTGHDAHCHCPLCLVWAEMCVLIAAVIVVVRQFASARERQNHAQSAPTAGNPVALAVKLNC